VHCHHGSGLQCPRGKAGSGGLLVLQRAAGDVVVQVDRTLGQILVLRMAVDQWLYLPCVLEDPFEERDVVVTQALTGVNSRLDIECTW
jgi:hypothetical protein